VDPQQSLDRPARKQVGAYCISMSDVKLQLLVMTVMFPVDSVVTLQPRHVASTAQYCMLVLTMISSLRAAAWRVVHYE
jgi:hypothetical protein